MAAVLAVVDRREVGDLSNLTIDHVSAEDHARITQAIRTVEKGTSGEIYAVVAHQSDDYFFVAGFVAALWALLFGVLLAGFSPFMGYEISPLTLAAAQAASFLCTMVVFWFFPQCRLWFVPRSLAYRRASNNAVRQFLAHGIHTTSDRSGVLVFVSLAEHYAEIVADAGINQKVSQGQWDDMVGTLVAEAKEGRLADGFVAVIEEAGGLLAEHFPPIAGQVSELDDRLVEI